MKHRMIPLIALCILLAGCIIPSEPAPSSTSLPPALDPTALPDEAAGEIEPVILGVAVVDEFDLQQNEDYPDLIEVTLRGSYPDSCTSLEEITVDEEHGILIMTLHTRRPKDGMCAQVLTPFEEVGFLEMGNRPSGEYALRVGEVEHTFYYDTSPLSCAEIAAAGHVNWSMPDRICPQASYLIYLHGKIVEDAGLRPTHPEYGPYEYEETLDVLAASGLQVISEWRPENTDGAAYADRVAGQVRDLLAAGVPAEQITVMGFSKGGAIAILTSSQLQHAGINYVILAACHEWAFQDPDILLSGRVLSIYEASDKLGVSCRPLFDRSPSVTDDDEIRIETGKAHGAFYVPDPLWVEPVIAWVWHQD
jgi:hypothetical protein